jgi:RNA polymerase sigma factor (sigma-70 family)
MASTQPNIRNVTFEQLMAEFAAGSEEAAWQIAETYTPHILRVVRASIPSAIRPKLDSQDFAQIVWASLLVKRSYLSNVKSPEQLIALLASVAQHKVIDAYRHYTSCKIRDLRRESPLEHHLRSSGEGPRAKSDPAMIDRGPSPSQIVGAREKWRAVKEELSPRDLEVLRRRLKGETYSQIADATGVSSATVRRVMSHVIELLQS